jgi:hypothetical protein
MVVSFEQENTKFRIMTGIITELLVFFINYLINPVTVLFKISNQWALYIY